MAAGSRAEGRHPDDLLDEEGSDAVRCVAVVRRGNLLRTTSGTRLAQGDSVWLAAPDELAERLAKAFAAGGAGNELTAHAGFFGEFVVDPHCPAGELAAAYGFELQDDEVELPLAVMFRRRLARPPVVGDKVSIGAFVLTVKEMDHAGHVTQMGLKCPSLPRLF